MRFNPITSGPQWSVGIDTGGTFTDLVAVGPKKQIAFKVPSTPSDPARAVLDALEELLRRRPDLDSVPLRLVHGSTVATNTLLENKGARVVFITNEGFEDLIEIGRQARPHLYELHPTKPPCLVPRADRWGVGERTDADGRCLRFPPDQEQDELRRKVDRRQPQAIAIGLLHGYTNPMSERRLARLFRSHALPVTLSSEVAPRFREFERFSTTVANAALLPGCRQYLSRLRRRLKHRTMLVQQSNGGLTSLTDASRFPVRLVLSGPAGGVQAATRLLGINQSAVTFDMGGTSTDVGLVHGRQASRTDQVRIGGRPLLVDSLEIHTIGAGGGSLLWLDDAGTLCVGPESAGADPGPACYGRGDRPTLTDAHVELGRLPLETPLGGSIQLDPHRSSRALAPLAKSLGVSVRRVALAALQIADAAMERAVKRISLEKGKDPRSLHLFGFGGAGGLHVCRLASRLAMKSALVPLAPGATSAWGMATSDARLDVSKGLVTPLDSRGEAELEKQMRGLEKEAIRRLDRELGPGPRALERTLACRYLGQSHELTVPWRRGYRRAFERLHRESYGFLLPGHALEAVALTCTAVRRFRRPPAAPVSEPREKVTPAGRCQVWFASRQARSVPIYERSSLPEGHQGSGPCVIRERTATTIVEPGHGFRVLPGGILEILGTA